MWPQQAQACPTRRKFRSGIPYSYIRRQGHDVAEAQDLTQEFFARLLERDYLARLDQQRGKFRSFLLAFVKHFLSEERDKARAQKRGGGHTLLSLDAGEGEAGYLSEPADELTPEHIFERRWVQTLLQRAFDRLAAEYIKVDKAALFEALKDFQPRLQNSEISGFHFSRLLCLYKGHKGQQQQTKQTITSGATANRK